MKRRSFLKHCGEVTALASIGGCTVLPGRGRRLPKGTIPLNELGKTGIKVSKLGFGSHLISGLIARPRERDRMIKSGFEGGITVFDVYDHNNYRQFKPMGNSIRDFRKNVAVSLCVVQPTDRMQEEIDGALRDFHTDYIDCYRLYTVDDDRMKIMEKNREAGKIRAIGIVSHEVNHLMGLVDRYRGTLDYVMLIYNFHHNKALILQDAIANDYTAAIPHLKEQGIGIIGIKPMGSDNMVELARKEGFFDDPKAHIAHAMLRHVYQTAGIDTTMPAMNSMEELAVDLESIYQPVLSPYEQSMLQKLSMTADSMKGAYLRDNYRFLERWTTRRA